MCIESQCNECEYNEYPSITRSIAITTPCSSNSLQPINLACRSESAEAQRAIYEDQYEAHAMRGELPPASSLMPQASCQDPRQIQARPEERVAPEALTLQWSRVMDWRIPSVWQREKWCRERFLYFFFISIAIDLLYIDSRAKNWTFCWNWSIA